MEDMTRRTFPVHDPMLVRVEGDRAQIGPRVLVGKPDEIARARPLLWPASYPQTLGDVIDLKPPYEAKPGWYDMPLGAT